MVVFSIETRFRRPMGSIGIGGGDHDHGGTFEGGGMVPRESPGGFGGQSSPV